VRGGAPQPGVSLVCGLGLDGEVPDHSTFSKNRHGRFRDSDLLRRLFETVLRRCIDTAYGTAEMLKWLVNEHGIEPHIPVFDKSQHTDGTSRATTSPMTTSATATSALPGRNSGSGKSSIGCRGPLSIETA